MEFVSRTHQVITTHSSLIVAVAEACRTQQPHGELEPVLESLQQHGQAALANALRSVLAGRRDPGLLQSLDGDQRIVVECVLQGIHNPASLPDPNTRPDPAAAAPGLASIVSTAAGGDRHALDMLDQMTKQMRSVGGDMAHLSEILRRLLQGERDPVLLCAGAGAACQSLVRAILDELARLDRH